MILHMLGRSSDTLCRKSKLPAAIVNVGSFNWAGIGSDSLIDKEHEYGTDCGVWEVEISF